MSVRTAAGGVAIMSMMLVSVYDDAVAAYRKDGPEGVEEWAKW